MKVLEQNTWDTAQAAQALADALCGTPEQWSQFLVNDRRPGRAQRIPVESGPGRPRYLRANIDAFVSRYVYENIEKASKRKTSPRATALEVFQDWFNLVQAVTPDVFESTVAETSVEYVIPLGAGTLTYGVRYERPIILIDHPADDLKVVVMPTERG